MLPRFLCRRHCPVKHCLPVARQNRYAAAFSSTSATAPKDSPSTGAIAFDIDGVLIRGKQLIPQAKEALHMLAPHDVGGSGRSTLPFIFLTNGGGVSEAEKARELSSWFDLRIPSSMVVLSHTPMQQYLPQYRHRRILVLGMTDVKSTALSYGFSDVVTVADIARHHPELVPHLVGEEPGGEHVDGRLQQHESSRVDLMSIAAIFVMHDPVRWYRDLQILLDVLTAAPSPPPLIFTNPDFLFSGRATTPRLAQGAFRVALAALYERLTGSELPCSLMGKPEAVTFKWAERVMAARAEAMGRGEVSRRYMIGDNPAADIRGANRAGWTSVLVETGTIARSKEPDDQPAHVAANVLDAVHWIVEQERLSQS